jgi:LmbE family N-acetylglucosaminyl deacetylase
MRILTVFAHPDDESFGPAGALAKYVQLGAELAGVWFTRGEAGETYLDPSPTPAELAVLRTDDLQEAARIIGYGAVDILDYPDGGLAGVPEEELEGVVRQAIDRHRPDLILTFGPGGISGHPDHITLSRVTTKAFRRSLDQGQGVKALYYDAVPSDRAPELDLSALPDGNPNTFIDASEMRAAHLAALAAHARHMADAREFLDQLEGHLSTYFRAYPPLPDGARITEFSTADEIEPGLNNSASEGRTCSPGDHRPA